jgi:FSR family fosmidomycin resistance protein-like MFS transporter
VLLYNFCAFAVQMPLGILADRVSKNYIFAAAGCILVGSAYGFFPVPVIAAVTAGLGNALFHLGGGIDVLNAAKGKAGILGVFVAPGGLGLFWGTMLGKGDGELTVFMLLMLLAAAGSILILCKDAPGNAPFSLSGAGISRGIIPAVAAGLFLVVCIRSYVGLSLNLPWKIALLIAAFTGKFAGGFIADWLGKIKVGFIALGLSAVLLLFPSLPVAGVFAVLLLNVTMPVTLWGMARLFPNAKGFAFGLLTFALFLGFLPVYYG